MVTEAASDTSYHATQEFTRKATELRNLVEELANSAPDAAKEQILGLKNGIASLCDQGTECTLDVTKRVVATVRAHPYQVAAAAVGAGLITWWLLSRR